MKREPLNSKEVDRFLLECIDSIPHLESLLLLWKDRPNPWAPKELASRLYVDETVARKVLQDLARAFLVTPVAGAAEQFHYVPGSEEKDILMEAVDATYRRELVRVTTIVHSKASSAVREFARAFRFTKEQD